MLKIFISIILSLILGGCYSGTGTHGSIKSYIYNCKKDTLQKAVMKVIKNNPKILRDTTLDYLGSSPFLDSSDCSNCKAGANYYNDIKHYVTIKIIVEEEANEYIFRYYGPDKSWDTLTSSRIFICYAHDKHGNGGSEGNGGVKWYQFEKKKKLIQPFEQEFISKIDSILGIKHTEE